MIVLADETLEKFFDVELGYSFKLTEKPAEQQKSLGREIFNNLLATGAKLATTAGVTRPQLLSRSTDNISITPSELDSTIDNLENMNLDNPTAPHEEATEEKKEEEKEVVKEESSSDKEDDEDHVIGSDSDELTDDEEELSPDVLEEVDRLLKEYGDEDDEN